MDGQEPAQRGRRDKNPNSPQRMTNKRHLRPGVTLYKVAESPYWRVRVWNPTKKKYSHRSTKETSRLEAAEVAEEWIAAQYANPKFHEPEIPRERTFEHFAKRMLLVNQASGSKYTARDESKILNRQKDSLLARFGAMDIGTITGDTIIQYFLDLDKARDKPLAATTKSKHVIILKKVFDLAAQSGAISVVPTLPKQKSKAKPRVAFSETEYVALLKAARVMASKDVVVRKETITLEMHHAIEFLAESFIRPTVTELFGFRLGDIEEIDTPTALHLRMHGKTGFRTSVTMPEAVEVWKRQVQLTGRLEPSDYLFFPHIKDRKKALDIAGRMFNLILEEGDLKLNSDGEPRSLYSLRHFSVQRRLINSGGKVNLLALAKAMGSSVEMIEKFYARYLPLGTELTKNLQTMADSDFVIFADGTKVKKRSR